MMNFPYDIALEINVDEKKTNEAALKEINYQKEELYTLSNDDICNLDDIPNGSMEEGDQVKIVIRHSLLQNTYNRYYLYIIE